MPTATAASPDRRPLLALAVAMTTSLAVLSPALAPTPVPDAGPLVRVVVSSGQAGLAGVAAAVQAAGGTVLDRLPLVGGVSADLPRDAVLAPSYVVVPDRPLSLSGAPDPGGPASTVRETLGLPPATSASGVGDGRGVKVAVVDTGVADVADLAGRLTHVDVTGQGTGDGYGHGTFVAGLIAGSGSASGGRYTGVAPAAQVLDVRVAGDDGSTSLVRVLLGLQAVAADPEVDVVNLSLSSGSPLPYQLDPLTRALEQLWMRGVVVVVPAGNGGPEGAISSPGLDPLLLTVGGLAEGGTGRRADDAVATWSSRGPAAQGVAKPDLVAPGSSVVSILSAGSAAARAQSRDALPAGYGVGSGTSFSTAVTSGAAAALLGERDLDPDQVKELVTRTAYSTEALGDRDAAGAGGLDLAAALAAPAPPVTTRLVAVAAPPGQDRRWSELLSAVLRHDVAGAEQAWDKLPGRHQEWAEHLWADSRGEGHGRGAQMWAGAGWTPADGPGELWQPRMWAASNWAASNWAATGRRATGRPATGPPATGRRATGPPPTGPPATGRRATGPPATGPRPPGRPPAGTPAAGLPATGAEATVTRPCLHLPAGGADPSSRPASSGGPPRGHEPT